MKSAEKHNNPLGIQLRQLRNYHDYPQRYLAHRLNISQYAYSKMERGITPLSESRLIEIASIYKLESWDLLHKPADDLIRQVMHMKSAPPQMIPVSVPALKKFKIVAKLPSCCHRELAMTHDVEHREASLFVKTYPNLTLI